MATKFEDIRSALCLSRGGWNLSPKSDIEDAWRSLTEVQRNGYLGRLNKLTKPERAAFEKDLPALPPDPKPAEPKPAGDEFAPPPPEPQPPTQASDDAKHPPTGTPKPQPTLGADDSADSTDG